ncbi:MAG: hypothetical protein AAF138_05840 [Planctomycetota bacterium]
MAKKSLMRNLGELFGGVVWGAKTNPEDVPPKDRAARGSTRELSREVSETRGPNGEKVTLRRTTVEEMIVEPLEDREHL